MKASNEIESLGGDGGLVTGSCHKLKIKPDSDVVIDYGLFQGRKEERSDRGERRNFTPTKDIAHGVTHILVTHSHIDHTGLLPKIFRAGFTPKILATETTAVFMETMLYNSAKIQSHENIQNRLYDEFDVNKSLRHLYIVDPFTEIPIGQKHSNNTAEFLPNGHVMGANSIIVRTGDKEQKQNILFTGDMGKPQQSLCGGYLDQVSKYPGDPINVLVVESTNFNKEPITFSEKRTNLLNGIKNVWKNGGNPLLPTLSFHRLQEIMEMIHNSQEDHLLEDCQIFIDAPLGISLLDNFKELNIDQLSLDYGDIQNYYQSKKASKARFNLKNVTVIDSHEESLINDEYLADYSGRCIIIASGGMGEHGRAVNYLRGKFCQNPKNAILFTCHQVDGTKGAAMVHYENIPKGKSKGARVIKIEGFTSHISGPTETFDFLERFNLDKLSTVIITHGKDTARKAMAGEFQRRGYDCNIVLPNLNQKVTI